MTQAAANPNILESLILKVGASHKYQYLMFGIFALKWFFSAMFLMSLNFLFYTEDFVCQNGENGSTDCNDWVCDNGAEDFWRSHLKSTPESLSYVFGWYICDKEWVTSLIQSLTYWGSFVGFVVFPFIADNFGRKRAEGISWVIAVVGAIILACAWNIVVAGIGLFLCGLGTNSAINLHYTFIKEYVVGKLRDIMIISLQITFSLGVCAIAFFSMYIPNWRMLSIFLFAIPMTLLLASYRFVEETPEFIIHNEGVGGLQKSLNKIAKINKRDEISIEDIEEALKDYSRDDNKLSLIDLFRYKSLRLTSYCCGVINMVIQFIYDGTLFSLNRVGLNMYTNQIVIGFAQMIAALYANTIVTKLRRKKYTMICLSLIGVLLAVFIFTGFKVDEDDDGRPIDNTSGWIQLVILIIMRFVLSSLWGFYFVYLSELYPSEVTSIAYGYMSAVGTLAASASPYIKLAAKDSSMTVMSAMSFVAVGHVWCLKETKGNPTQMRIKEREKLEYYDTINQKLSQIST